ncbi:hypothetical protein ACFQ1S_36870, partial [Kibdelosporangium lantanae]
MNPFSTHGWSRPDPYTTPPTIPPPNRTSIHTPRTCPQPNQTHWLAPDISDARKDRLTQRQNTAPDLMVHVPLTDWTCAECSDTGPYLIMDAAGPTCLTCADMDHLVFLPSGDATLTRRARKASGLAAVVVRFNKSRKRYDRKGILVEERALEEAEQSCLADEE